MKQNKLIRTYLSCASRIFCLIASSTVDLVLFIASSIDFFVAAIKPISDTYEGVKGRGCGGGTVSKVGEGCERGCDVVIRGREGGGETPRKE